ncbi:hypothetical protein NMY22_g698 [Coprinellus aureogranulatus]|nr:hypothetical protein NMY22_g698 [Coprinellus aureogranulatus]
MSDGLGATYGRDLKPRFEASPLDDFAHELTSGASKEHRRGDTDDSELAADMDANYRSARSGSNSGNEGEAVTGCTCGEYGKKPQRPTVTPWRLVNTSFVLCFALWKWKAAVRGDPTANNLDLVLGLGWALIVYWAGIIEQEHPSLASWFFHTNAIKVLLVLLYPVTVFFALLCMIYPVAFVSLCLRNNLAPMVFPFAMLTVMSLILVIVVLGACAILDHRHRLAWPLSATQINPFSLNDWNGDGAGRLFRNHFYEAICLFALEFALFIFTIVKVAAFSTHDNVLSTVDWPYEAFLISLGISFIFTMVIPTSFMSFYVVTGLYLTLRRAILALAEPVVSWLWERVARVEEILPIHARAQPAQNSCDDSMSTLHPNSFS